MKFEDLKVEQIKTLMATQRILCLKSGYAISFMGDEQDLTSGDGINTFEIRVFKHNLDLDKPLDLFNSSIDSDAIDFRHTVFELKAVPLSEIHDFFEAFVL